MKFLLDTNIFLWFINGNSKLPLKFRDIIENDSYEIFISIVSLWEIGIKYSIGRLELKRPFDDLVSEVLKENNINILSLKPKHIKKVVTIPFHHSDPFDRIIISQSIIELLYTDEIFNNYFLFKTL